MKKWNFYTTNEIKPVGWLKRQLEIQANGLSGNLDKVWRDVRDSAWTGGEAEGWERVPYWLDGFIPLAYLLEDGDMIARAKKYVDAIISRQRPDGWICPCSEEKIADYDTWAVQLISKVLVVYYECSGDERIPQVLYKAMKNYHALLSEGKIKLFNWGEYRWFEAFFAINFLRERYGEPWIDDLAAILKRQGADYAEKAETWKKPINRWTYHTHIVNIGMMLKAEAVSHGVLGEEYVDRADYFYNLLDEYNGTPVGIFTGDECLAGLSPIHGTELCAVAEQMFSCEQLFAYTGDKKWAERLELMAFNALPATISDDMWTHQYDQLSNQIACVKFHGKPIFGTNGDEAHLFGLEPNYGCCTANFNQAWPKLALSAFMHNGSSVISAVPVPSELKADGVHITLETEYPFKNSLLYKIEAQKAFSLTVRIPSFAENLTVNGKKTANSGELIFDFNAGDSAKISIDFEAAPRFVERPYGLKTVQCGSLVFSLPIKLEKVMREYERNGVERKYPYCDYELFPKSDWNYGYCGDELRVVRGEVGEIPFSSENPPIKVLASAAKVQWDYEEGYDTVCAKLPSCAEAISEAEEVALYPYGCAKLRMTELPMIEK